MNTAQQVDILSPQFKANPFPLLARLRTDQPVRRITLPDKTPVWLVTRYEDVKALLADERFAKSRYNALTPEQLRKQPWVPPMFRPLERTMIDLDPPGHTRLRQFVHKAFTPRLIEQMRERVQTLANELLDAVARKGEMDLIRDYALPLPMTIISEILGVPVQDRDKFHKWSKVIVAVDQFNANWRVIPAIWMFNRYLRGFFKVRRADLRDDLVSAFIRAEEAGDSPRINSLTPSARQCDSSIHQPVRADHQQRQPGNYQRDIRRPIFPIAPGRLHFDLTSSRGAALLAEHKLRNWSIPL